MKKTVIMVAFLIGFINLSYSWAETFTCGNGANSCTGDAACTISNLNICISNAADGDTINIEAGTYSWTPGSSTYVNVNKRLTVSGGGSCPNCGTSSPTSGASWPVTINLPSSNNYAIFRVAVTTSESANIARISGFYITGDVYGGYDAENNNGFICVTKENIAQYRIDNNRFKITSGGDYDADIWLLPMAYGLIDHNYFNPDDIDGKSIVILRLSTDEAEYDCVDSWLDAVDFGTANFVFIEDNTCVREGGSKGETGAHMFIDSFCGARFVFRYNYLYNTYSEFHGLSQGSWTSAGYAMEMYYNTMNNNTDMYRAWWFRGGTGLIHHNTISGTYNRGELLQFGDSARPSTSNWDGWGGDWDGNCHNAGSASNTNVSVANGFNYDCGDVGNPYPTGYPTIFQPGWGQISSETYALVQPQSYSPIRAWSNTNNTAAQLHLQTEADNQYISLNRDFFASTDASAALSGYTPYTYPHPLRDEGTTPSTMSGVNVFDGGTIE